MTPPPESDKLLHDIHSKCSSLRSATKALKDCAPKEAHKMLALMVGESRDILKCVLELQETAKQRR